MLQTTASGTKRNATAQQSGISKSSLYVAMTFKSLHVDCLHRMLLGKLKKRETSCKKESGSQKWEPPGTTALRQVRTPTRKLVNSRPQQEQTYVPCKSILFYNSSRKKEDVLPCPATHPIRNDHHPELFAFLQWSFMQNDPLVVLFFLRKIMFLSFTCWMCLQFLLQHACPELQ